MKALIIGMDGVLVDSFEAMHRAAANHLVQAKVEPPSRKEFFKHAGKPFKTVVKALLHAESIDEEKISLAEQKYEGFFFPLLAKTMPGVVEGLAELKKQGVIIVLVSNNTRNLTDKVLARKELQGLVDVSITVEECEKQLPDSVMVTEVLSKLGISKEETLFLCATAIDVDAAKAAGIRYVLLKNGFNKRIKANKVNSFADFTEELRNGKLD